MLVTYPICVARVPFGAVAGRSLAPPFRKRLGCVDAEEVQAPPLEYLDRYELRYVSANGGIRWNNRWVNVSTTCIGEYVGLEEIEDGDCYPCPRTKG